MKRIVVVVLALALGVFASNVFSEPYVGEKIPPDNLLNHICNEVYENSPASYSKNRGVMIDKRTIDSSTYDLYYWEYKKTDVDLDKKTPDKGAYVVRLVKTDSNHWVVQVGRSVLFVQNKIEEQKKSWD